MNVSEIIKLIDAGYTKADIEAMNENQDKPAEPQANTAADQAPATPSPTAGTEQPDAAAVNAARLQELKQHQAEVNAAMLQELKDLKKAVYAMNIMNSEQPAEKSVDDILAKSLK